MRFIWPQQKHISDKRKDAGEDGIKAYEGVSYTQADDIALLFAQHFFSVYSTNTVIDPFFGKQTRDYSSPQIRLTSKRPEDMDRVIAGGLNQEGQWVRIGSLNTRGVGNCWLLH